MCLNGPKKGLILALFCHFRASGARILLAVTLILNLTVHADDSQTLYSVMHKLYATGEMVDDRMSTIYLQTHFGSSIRYELLLNEMAESSEGREWQIFRDRILESHGALFNRLYSIQINSQKLDAFYAETILLFNLLKRQQSGFLRDQFEHWLHSLDSIDFRHLSRAQVIEWTDVIAEIFAYSVTSTMPWTEKQKTFIANFLAQQSELQAGQWNANFKRAAKQAGNSQLDSRSVTRLLTIMFATAPMALAYIIGFASSPAGKAFTSGMESENFGVLVLSMISGLAFGFGPMVGGVTVPALMFQKSPHLYSKRRWSYAMDKIRESCETALSGNP